MFCRAPRKRANIGLVPRVLAKQTREKKDGEEDGGEKAEREGERGGEEREKAGESEEAMEVAEARSAPKKMSNDDFRNLFNKS